MFRASKSTFHPKTMMCVPLPDKSWRGTSCTVDRQPCVAIESMAMRSVLHTHSLILETERAPMGGNGGILPRFCQMLGCNILFRVVRVACPNQVKPSLILVHTRTTQWRYTSTQLQPIVELRFNESTFHAPSPFFEQISFTMFCPPPPTPPPPSCPHPFWG